MNNEASPIPHATIADVAREAGVSQATVSRTLHGSPKVSPATRERVLAAADRLRFTLSQNASSLASGRTGRVLVLCSGPLGSWFNAGVMQGAYEEAHPQDYDLTPACVTGREELDAYAKALPTSRNADAAIVCSFRMTDSLATQLGTVSMPTVGVDIPGAPRGFDASVGVDNAVGMRRAVRLLRSLGHPRIAFACDLVDDGLVYNASERREAFLEAAAACGYGPGEARVVTVAPHGPIDVEGLAERLAVRVLSDGNRPTALCVETDLLAIALVAELRRQGIRVPQDMSVIGFDDAAVARVADLTTVRQDPVELGRRAMSMALGLLHGEEPVVPHVLVEPSLVLRGTTARHAEGEDAA